MPPGLRYILVVVQCNNLYEMPTGGQWPKAVIFSEDVRYDSNRDARLKDFARYTQERDRSIVSYVKVIVFLENRAEAC